MQRSECLILDFGELGGEERNIGDALQIGQPALARFQASQGQVVSGCQNQRNSKSLQNYVEQNILKMIKHRFIFKTEFDKINNRKKSFQNALF